MHLIRQLLLIALFASVSLTGALAQDAVGSITAGSGEVVVIRSAGGEVPGTVGTEIHQHDQIYVGDGGEATVTFVDQTILTLGGGSAVTVDELVYDPGSQTNSGVFTLAGGLMGLVSGDIMKTGDMMVTTPVSTIGIRGTAVLIDSGTRITRLPDGGFAVTTSNADGEIVTLVVSPDGTVGTVTVTNTETGAATILNTFGDTVQTQNIGGSAVQVRSTLTAAELAARFGPILQALQNATGVDLGDPANVTEAAALQEALQDLLDTIEENPNQDASPD
jgi:hypothetical protein